METCIKHVHLLSAVISGKYSRIINYLIFITLQIQIDHENSKNIKTSQIRPLNLMKLHTEPSIHFPNFFYYTRYGTNH